jgi:hypothetical protein
MSEIKIKIVKTKSTKTEFMPPKLAYFQPGAFVLSCIYSLHPYRFSSALRGIKINSPTLGKT